jgi:hypothetical protein
MNHFDHSNFYGYKVDEEAARQIGKIAEALIEQAKAAQMLAAALHPPKNVEIDALVKVYPNEDK